MATQAEFSINWYECHWTKLCFFQGVSFADSAFALIAFVLDRWALATDPDYSLNGATQLHRFLTVDELLTNIFVCWLTQTLPHGAHVLANTANHSHMQMFRCVLHFMSGARLFHIIAAYLHNSNAVLLTGVFIFSIKRHEIILVGGYSNLFIQICSQLALLSSSFMLWIML